MSDEPLDQPEFVETFSATTTDLPEGTNLYYTDVRARAALSAGFGISYDNNTGVISYAGFGSDDTLLSVGLNNTDDLLDIGFVGKYVSAGTKYTGLFRDASDGKYKLYQGLTSAPTANVVDLTGGVLADLSVGSLSATSITGTLQTGSQPNITALGGITTIRNIPVGANAIGDGSTALTGVLQTVSQPLITTLANVTSLNATPIGTNSIGNSATVLNGVLQTSAQPNITTLANVSSINSVPIGPSSVGDDTTALGGVLLTDHQPLIATLPSLSNFNGIPVSANAIGNSSTALSGVLQTGSQPNITTLSNTTNVNGIPISANAIGNISTALNGVLQTAGQPNILLTEYNLTSLTDITVANVSTTKHGLMPKLSGSATDMFLGNGTWGPISTETLPSLLLNGPTNAGDTVDIGFLGKYVLSGDKYTGLFRDATDGKYKLYHGLTVAPGSDVVNLTSGVLSELVLGTLTATNITGSLQTVSQPYITTLASVTSINSIPVSANALGDASTALTGVVQTPSQPLITTLSGVTNINGVPISNNSIGNHNTALYGVLQTPSRPNVPTLSGVVSINSIPVGPNSLGSSNTALTGILQTPLQPYLTILESNLSGFTDITTANANVSKHGLLPKLSGNSTDVLRGNGTWGAVTSGVVASLESLSIFGDNNPADLLDIGFLGTYTDIGTKYTGLFRDATDGKYKLYHGLTVAPSGGVVNLTSGVLSELVVGTLTSTNVSATNITGTLQTASQPNITTLASVTSLNGWTVGSGTLSGGSSISATNVTGTLQTASQPNITTLAGVTSINSIPVSSNALGNSSTALTGVIQTVSQPNITTLAGVTSLNGWTVGSGTLSGGSSISATNVTGTLTTAAQPNITTLASVTSLNGWTVGSGTLLGGSSISATNITGTLQTSSQPNITTLAGVTSLNNIIIGNNSINVTDLTVTNLVVNGITTFVNSTNLSINDPLISLAANNTATDVVDIGVFGTYASSGTKYTGLFRDATDGKWKIYNALTALPTTTIDITTGILGELVLGTLTSTNLAGTLSTASQPNITTLAGVTSLNGWTVGSGTLSGGSSVSATNLTGTLQTASQPNITTLASVTSLNGWTVGSGTLSGGSSISATNITGTLQTVSQPNITTLAGVTSLNSIPHSANALGNSSTALTGVIQTASQPNIAIVETNLASFTDVTTANSTSLKHGLLPKLSNIGTDVLRGDGTWGAAPAGALPSLLLPGPTNPADLLDIGFLGTYVSSGTKYTGLFRDATDGKYKLYHGLTVAPSSNVVDLTSGVLSELVLGTLTATSISGTLSTASQPNITTLASVTSLNGWTVGSGTLSGGSSISATNITGTLQTASQPNVTTLAGVTSLNSITVGSGTLSGLSSVSATSITGTLQTASQPNVTTLAGVTSIGASSATTLTGTLQTASQPNVTTLAGVTSLNTIPISANALGNSFTALTGVVQTASQPNIAVVETNLASFTDITTANATNLKHGLLPKLSNVVTDVLRGDGTWGLAGISSLMLPNPANPADLLDIGFLGTYVATGTKYTGLFRDATDGKYKLYHGLTVAPTGNVVDLTSGVLSELVLGTLTATNVAGTLSTASQPNITTLAGVTSINSIPYSSNALGNSSTALTGTIQTASQPNITTLAGVTSLNGWTIGSGTLSGGSSVSATNITGTLQTASQPNITTLAGVTSLNTIPISANALGNSSTALTGIIQTASQPNISVLEANLAGFTDITTANSTSLKHGLLPKLSGVGTDVLKGDGTWGAVPSGAQPSLLLPGPTNPADLLDIGFLGTYVATGTKYTGLFRDATDGKYKLYHGLTVAPTADVVDLTSGVLSELVLGTLTATTLAGTLSTASQPNITTLAGVTSLNSIPISSNALGDSSTAITGGTATLSTAVNVTQNTNATATLATFTNSNAGTSAQAQINVLNDAGIGLRFGVLSSTFTGTPNDAFISTNASSSDLTIRAGTGDGLFLNNNGYLCVGAINPSNILQVGNAGRLRISNGTTDYSVLGTIDVDGSTNTKVVVSGNTRASFPGQIDYVATSTGSHLWYTGGTSLRMTLNSSGQLGIGIAPTAKLHLSDSIAGANVQAIFQNTNASTSAYNEFQLLNSGSLGLRFGITSPLYTGWLGDAFIYNSNNAGIAFGSNNTQRAYLSAAGNFGIGSYTNAAPPGVDLDVVKSVNGAVASRVRNSNSGSSAYTTTYVQNDGAGACYLFLNSTTRSADGGTNTATLRNDAGRLRLQSSGSNGIEIESSTGAMFTNSGRFELGQLGTGDRPAYVDFHSSGVANALDFSARLIRNSGVNGTLELNNTGTGGMYFSNLGVGFYQWSGVSGGSAYNYTSNTTSASDKVQVAGSHQMRTYVDTSGNAICGTITATPLYLRTNNTNRVTIDGSSGLVTTSAGITLGGTLSSTGYSMSTGGNLSCNLVSTNTVNTNTVNATTYQKSSVTGVIMQYASSAGAPQVIATPTVQWAHGLPSVPDLVQCYIICTTADVGYFIGDVLQVTNYFQSGNSMNSVGYDGTNVFFKCNPLRIVVARKDTGGATDITTGSWRMFFKAWRVL